MRSRLAPLTILLCLLAAGCTTYSVRVTGYLDVPDAQRLPAGASVHVVEDEEVENRILQREIALKIERLVRSKGHVIAPAETADYHLLFEYGMSGPQTVWDTRAIAYPGSAGSVRNHGPHGYSYYTYSHSPSVVHVPYTRTVYTRWLTLKTIDAARYRGSGESLEVWRAEATSTGRSDDLREVMNYLLVAAFEHFGEDTGRQVVRHVRRGDARVEQLRNP